MKVNMTDEIRQNTLISHIILHKMSEALAESIAKEGQTEDGVVVDVKLTANGKEIDLEHFIQHWQSQVDNIITEKARELVNDKLSDVCGMLYDLEERLKSEIDKRLEDWEKEVDNTGNNSE